MKFLLVGAGFHPGAQALLSKGLAQEARVTLIPEPENPYDPNAVKVAVEREEVQESEDLDEALAGFGLNGDTMEWPFMLGHLGASYGTKAAKRALQGGHKFDMVEAWHQNQTESGTLEFTSNGSVFVNTKEKE